MKDILVYLQKGALLAQNPSNPEAIQELDQNDLEVIHQEKTRMHYTSRLSPSV